MSQPYLSAKLDVETPPLSSPIADGVSSPTLLAQILQAKQRSLAGQESLKSYTRAKIRKWSYLVPRDREAWLDFLLKLVKKKTQIKYLPDREVLRIIVRARGQLGRKKFEPVTDPHLPQCFDWTEEQVAEWIEEIGFPQYKEAFTINHITGRRLIEIDANALNKMGLRYFDDIKAVASKIRELLGIHRPNMLRAIMRKVPFELYLKKRHFTGPKNDSLTFRKFCEENGFPYEFLEDNKNALIECTTSLAIYKAVDEFSSEDSSFSEHSLYNAPSVEFTVLQITIRNKIVNGIIDELINAVFESPANRRYGRDTMKCILDIMHLGMEELGLDRNCYDATLKFAQGIAEEMLTQVRRTAVVLQDIETLRKEVDYGQQVTEKDLSELKEISEEFLNDAFAIAVLLATGQLDLENIFRQESEFTDFVDEVVKKAEFEAKGIENQLPPEAKYQILKKDYPNLDLRSLEGDPDLRPRIIESLFNGECNPLDWSSCLTEQDYTKESLPEEDEGFDEYIPRSPSARSVGFIVPPDTARGTSITDLDGDHPEDTAINEESGNEVDPERRSFTRPGSIRARSTGEEGGTTNESDIQDSAEEYAAFADDERVSYGKDDFRFGKFLAEIATDDGYETSGKNGPK